MSNKLNEGLRSNDLEHWVHSILTIDQFKSKMGDDADVIVLAFRVTDKHPATDLMEFIEKGYPYVLDADISAGEEKDGTYSVFVEFERTIRFPKQAISVLDGVSQLCGIDDWRFKYYKELKSIEVSKDALAEHVPLTDDAYRARMLELKNGEVSNFFSQGATESVTIDANNMLTIQRPYAEKLEMQMLQHGPYDIVKESVQGGMQFDSASVGQTMYLQKFLGDYDISKIGGLFLIRNGDQAMVLRHREWGH